MQPERLNNMPQNMPFLRKVIQHLENTFLVVIGTFAVIAMAQEVYETVRGMRVSLKDLLLMFIYVEVLAMVAVYYESKKIPITLPLFIAITAIARLLILQGKDQPPQNLLYESSAILILSIACAVISYRPPERAHEASKPDNTIDHADSDRARTASTDLASRRSAAE
jgi:protein PsiE